MALVISHFLKSHVKPKTEKSLKAAIYLLDTSGDKAT